MIGSIYRTQSRWTFATQRCVLGLVVILMGWVLGGTAASAQAQANQLAGQNQSPKGSQYAAIVSVDPLVYYTPLGPTSPVQSPFWKKHLPDDAGSTSISLTLSEPAGPYGAIVFFSLFGTAESGVHYKVNSLGAVRFMPGETTSSLQIELLNSGEYFKERSLEFKLTYGFGCTVSEAARVAQIWIRPTALPPTLEIANTNFAIAPGSQTIIPVTLSEPCQEQVSFHYRVDGGSTLTDYLFAPTGTVVFQPGETTANLRLLCDPTALVGQRLVLHVRHERKSVRLTIPALDAFLTSNPDLYTQDVHLDENLWTFSEGGVQEFEHHVTRNPSPSGITMPGVPTDNITGGSFWESGREGEELIDLLPQTDPNPLVDPFSGIPLKIYAISEAATGVVPYLRKSFDSSFCGSNTQLYSLPEFLRISYYIALPHGTDAGRVVPFFRAGIRVRSQDLNHGVTFRIGSTGLDSLGNAVPVYQTSLGPIGAWSYSQINSSTSRYGIVEDEFGVRVWFAHRLDPTVGYTHPVGGDVRFETPGVDKGNPIEYPTWVSSGDGSLASIGLSTVDDATGLGNLPYGLQWEVSHEASIYGGDLNPYFPKFGSWWEPQGNATINQSMFLFFIVQ